MSPVWWISLDTFLIFMMLVGGFFMFRSFLRKMKPVSPELSDQEKEK